MRFLVSILLCLVVTGGYANPVERLLDRIAPGSSHRFITRIEDSPRDFFELSQEKGKVLIKGNTWVNVATGLNWYLKYYAGIHLSWNQMSARLPQQLPLPQKAERHETDLRLRYDFNYCTFSYSMAFWDWKRWQREIDWMALHGVNMPLAVTGAECVWRRMLLRLGYTEEQIGQFIAGPAFLAWWQMNNLEGWGGPLPMSWYRDHEQLQKRILKEERAWGMTPVLPGYCGMLPSSPSARPGLGQAARKAGKKWNGYTRPAILDTNSSDFDTIADIYYEELTRLFGKARYYSMDPFHETDDDASIDYAKAGDKLLKAMKRANPEATWVVQGWTENPREEMIRNIPEGDLLVLDLFSECRPMFGAPSIWRRANGYGRHGWLFCMLENFGGNVGLHGRIDQLLDNYYMAAPAPGTPVKEGLANAASHLKGIGFTMEGIENNPVMFELMSELPWRSERVEREKWLASYVKARYGKDHPDVQQAWQLLGRTIYNCPRGNNQQGPHESIFDGRPSLNNFQVKSWSKMRNYYDPDDTRRAAELMVKAADAFRGNNNFEYDLVDIVRQAMDDQARLQYHRVIADYKAGARRAFSSDSARFLRMLLLQDSLLGTRREFRLGHWTEAARALGHTPQEKDQYEWNARVQITTWGNRECANKGGLRDYAHKEWQGLLRDFYFMRWHTYFDALSRQMARQTQPDPDALGAGPNANKTADELFQMALPAAPVIDWYALEEPWTLQHQHYSPDPEGNSVDVARRVMAFLASGR